MDPTKVSSCKVAASKYDKDSVKPHAQDLATEFGFADPDAATAWRKAQLAEYKKAGWPKDLYGRGSIKTGAAGNISNLTTHLGAYQGGSIVGIPLGTGAAPVPLASAPATSPEPEEATEEAAVVEEVPSPAPPPLGVTRELVHGSYPTDAVQAEAPHLEHDTLGMDILTMGEKKETLVVLPTVVLMKRFGRQKVSRLNARQNTISQKGRYTSFSTHSLIKRIINFPCRVPIE